MPLSQKNAFPASEYTDTQVNVIAVKFYKDTNFSYSLDKKNINMWQVFNLFTEVNKYSYIDTFLSRSVETTHFTQGICQVLEGKEAYQWFIQ